MLLSESILTALFCMAVVFAVLGILWAMIRIFSSFIGMIENKHGKDTTNASS